MANVTTVAGRLYVDDRGEGPPIVLWPSLLCDGTLFREQKDELARDHRVLTIDPPGHGRSERAGHVFTLDECAEAELQVLDAFGLDEVVLGGLSWGGMTALRVALRAPERVRALVLLDTSADAESPRVLPQYRLMLEVFRLFGPVGPLVPAIQKKMFSPRTLRSRPEVAGEFLSRLRTFDRVGVCEAVEAVIFERRSIQDEIGRIEAPALVACGADDVSTPPFRSERIAQKLPNARFELIPGAGHLSAIEAPLTVNTLLRDFLMKLEADAPLEKKCS